MQKGAGEEPSPPLRGRGQGEGGGGAKARLARLARAPGALQTSERAERQAKRLRGVATRAEQSLWKALRKLAPEGAHFRRQVPIGPYVVDFASHGARLIVEVDGGIHELDVVSQRDAARDAWLKGRGYAVIRITNQQALFDPVGAAERILAERGVGAPTPTPPRKGEGL